MNIQGFNNYNNMALNNYSRKNRIQYETLAPEQQSITSTPSFKGKEESKFLKWLGKTFSKFYGEKVYNSERLQTLSEKLAKMNLGDITTHMQVLGSTITSGVYVSKTLNNDKIESENKPALAANQAACWALPTIGAYWTDKKLRNKIKNREYRYSGLNDQKHALSNMTKEQLKAAEKKLAFRKGLFRTLASTVVFTTIYRFITPVFVTPFTNKFGNWWNNHKKAKKAQEVVMTPNYDNKKLSTAA